MYTTNTINNHLSFELASCAIDCYTTYIVDAFLESEPVVYIYNADCCEEIIQLFKIFSYYNKSLNIDHNDIKFICIHEDVWKFLHEDNPNHLNNYSFIRQYKSCLNECRMKHKI